MLRNRLLARFAAGALSAVTVLNPIAHNVLAADAASRVWISDATQAASRTVDQVSKDPASAEPFSAKASERFGPSAGVNSAARQSPDGVGAGGKVVALSGTGTYDNFNRTVSNPFWGTASSGFGWQTDNTGGTCSGYTASVDGQVGILTGSAGAICSIWTSLTQLHHPGVGNPAAWKASNWSFTGEFKVNNADNTQIQFGFVENVSAVVRKNIRMSMSPTGSVAMAAQALGASGSAPFAFTSNTWYAFKWINIWGDQQRLKVWPLAGSEPSAWLLTQSLAGESTTYLDDASFGVLYDSRTGPTSGYFDNFSFGPAPILPDVPIPAGTEFNGLLNQGVGGDPVSTYTGSFADRHVDLAIPGRGPTPQLVRAYNSNDTRVTALGPGWTHSYNIRLVAPGDATADVVLIGPEGRSDRYIAGPSGFSPPVGVHRSLVRNTDETYTATDKSQTVWSFDPTGRLISIVDRFGNASNMTYNGTGQLTGVSDPAGRGSLTLAYTSGKLTSVTDWASPARVVTYQYDGSGRLWKVTDRNNKTTTYTYDGTSQRLATIPDARTVTTLTLTYDGSGRVATQKDGRGLVTGDVTTFGYLVNPDSTRDTTVTAPVTSFEPSFHPTLIDSYDANSWLVQRVTAPSSTGTLTQSYTFDAAGNQLSATDPRGNTTNFCYDVDYTGATISGAAGNLTRVIAPSPTPGAARPVILTTYDAKNNVLESVAPKGVPSGTTVTCATDLSAINSAYATTYAFDAAGVLMLSQTTRSTDPELGLRTSTTKFEYTDAANPGQITKIIPPRGNTGGSPDYTYATTSTYYTSGVRSGMLKDVTDPLGNKTSYDYDAVGRVISLVDPLGNVAGAVASDHTTSFTYDAEDRTRFRYAAPPSAGASRPTTETRYDEVGNPIVLIDANGQVSTYTFDARNSLSQVRESALSWTDPNTPPATVILTEYTRDAGGNPTRIMRAKGDATNERAVDYVYDGRGLPRSESQYPAWPSTLGALVTQYAYDGAGNQTTVTDPLGQILTVAYDALNRRTSLDYSSATTPDVAYSFDANGNRTQMIDGNGTTSYVVDEANRLTSVTSPGPKVLGYRYDLDGNRTKLIYPDGTAVAYSFNKAAQMASLQDWAARTVSYTYFPDGLVKDATNPNGTVTRNRYDNDRRLIGIGHTAGTTQLADFGYTLDGVGNVTRLTEGATGTLLTDRVSVSTAGAQGNDESSYWLGISTDGRYVVYPSFATNLVAGDTNAKLDIFLRDRTTSTTTRVSLSTAGAQANGHSDHPALSPDGRFVVFESDGTALVTADSNNKRDIFLRDLQTSVTTRVSISSSGAQAKLDCYAPAVSSTGRYVAFETAAKELVSGDNNGNSDIFVRDTQTGTTTRVSVTSAGAQGNGNSNRPSISADGRYVAFVSAATNLVAGDTNGVADIFVRDRQVNITTRVSVATAGTQSNGLSTFLAISGDGRYVTFDSDASNLVAGDTNGSRDVFLRDLQSSTTTRVSVAGDGSQGNSTSQGPSISADGRYVSFGAFASNLVQGDTNGVEDAFVRDIQSATTTRYSTSSDGTQGTGDVLTPTISSNGSFIAFLSSSNNLVSGDTNAVRDVFVHSEPPSTTTTYAYDRLSRLLTAAAPEGSYAYAYDLAGNRTSKSFSGSTGYTYDRADRMLTAGAASVSVNANGNLVAKGTDSYVYDQANRLTSSTVASVTTTYLYDGDGTRFGSTVTGSPAERWVSDSSGSIATLVDDGVRKYVYGMGLAYTVAGTTVEVYHVDRLGSVRLLTNGSGAISATYRLDPWGSPVSSTGSSSQPLGYTGEPGGSGLTYLRTRYYSAELGRFLTRDQWPGVPAASQTQNRYSYVANNPTTRTDPSGRFLDTLLDAAFIVYDIASLVWGPEKDRGTNFLALSLDIGGLFIPFVTGGGAAVRTAEHADEAIGGIKWLDEAAQAACSFTGDTLVATPDGPVPISEIEIGDVVLAWDEAAGEVVEREVTAVMPHPDDEIAVLALEDGDVTTTPDHPFFTTERGWVEAGQLWPGAHVRSVRGTTVVQSIVVEPYGGILWDLSVAGVHNFFVGPSQALVHNCTIDPRQLQRKYKHAPDFGITGDWNKVNGAAFEDAIQTLVANNLGVTGALRGRPGVWHLDPSSGVAVFLDLDGNFVTGYYINPQAMPYFPYLGGGD